MALQNYMQYRAILGALGDLGRSRELWRWCKEGCYLDRHRDADEDPMHVRAVGSGRATRGSQAMRHFWNEIKISVEQSQNEES